MTHLVCLGTWVNEAQTQLQRSMAMSSDATPTSTALVEAQNVTITPIEFHNRTSYKAEIPSWNSTPSLTRDEMSVC